MREEDRNVPRGSFTLGFTGTAGLWRLMQTTI
jgi:hypothetical protein